MATVLTPNLELAVSPDGKLLTFTDGSNWTDNTGGYVRTDFVRTVELRDYLNAVITTLTFAGSSDTIQYEVTKDLWITSILTFVGPVTLTQTVKYPLTQIYDDAFSRVVDSTECACSPSQILILTKANFFRKSAFVYGRAGNSTRFQKHIDAANKFINLLL